MKKTTKGTLSALPVARSAQLLVHQLTPDPFTPTPAAFRTRLLADSPSIQRRARLALPQSHFSYVTPFPVPFPYNIDRPADPPQDKADYIEEWLADREAVHKHDAAPSTTTLRKYYSLNRDQPRILLGVSEFTLRDCLPHLDVGDAFATLGAPSLSNPFADEGDHVLSTNKEAVHAREDLIDILSGHAVLMSDEASENIDDPRTGFAPWALRYSGHQFGNWAGQLGDGRAVSILTTPHPADPDITYELQLKGPGRTPFSRGADGLAVVRSSIREYLCSEAINALSIPTTRALALITLPSLPVARESLEHACILTRIAPSFLRIGSFEAFNGSMLAFGGVGQQKPHWDALRILGEWVTQRVLRVNIPQGEPWGKALLFDVAQRNAKMVAAWQAYGFMHGVINTDNVSIMGLTIDYGPYAFMDVFDSFHICNHSDAEGRYAYRYQPDMIVYAMRALLNALAPLIGAEQSLGKAVSQGWADNASEEQLEEWRKKGLQLEDELVKLTRDVTIKEYASLMRKRLAIRREISTDDSQLVKPLLNLMESHKLDFSSTFRTLTNFRPSMIKAVQDQEDGSPALQDLIKRILAVTPYPERMDVGQATQELMEWLDKYATRIESEKDEWGTDLDGEREKAAKTANPRFVLRQWLLEEVISKVGKDVDSGKRALAKVLHMAANPFEPWGAEDEHDKADHLLEPEEKEERRYCGMGEKRMLGFQCSCSS
ncbi:hypothetical protein AX15_005078 [Amanita polypyramis BW_CC]|nr:hypothetical protein AX15_005078 [Amanita polypyramis BW_CC]